MLHSKLGLILRPLDVLVLLYEIQEELLVEVSLSLCVGSVVHEIWRATSTIPDLAWSQLRLKLGEPSIFFLDFVNQINA